MLSQSMSSYPSMAKSRWLNAIGDDLARLVLAGANRRKVPSGQSIYALHDTEAALYGVLSGGVGVQIDDRETGVFLGHAIGAGGWFGEVTIVTGQPRVIGTVALTHCELLQIPGEYLVNAASERGDLWRALAVLTAMNAGTSIQAARDLMVQDTRNRCLSVLTRLAGSFPKDRAIPLTQQQLADTCRMSRSNFAKMMSELEAEGIVERRYGELIVHGKDAMPNS
ncbi:MAG: Crp/Fnr family transcriptional regulator [Paracoccaceae bacterium]